MTEVRATRGDDERSSLISPCTFGLVALPEKERFRTQSRSGDPSNVWYGMGLNGLTGVRGADMVEIGGDLLGSTDEPFQKFDFDKIETTEKLRSTLEVSAAASYRGVSLAAAGHASYYRSASLDKYSIKVYGRVDVKLKRGRLLKKTLTENAKAVVGDRETFFANFGDLFVDQIVYGGTYILLLDFTAETKREFEAMEAGVQAAMNEWAASGNIRSTFERVFRQKVTSAFVLSNGVVQDVAVEPSKLLDQMIGFPESVKASGGVPIAFETLRATTAQGATSLPPFRYTEAANRFEELAQLSDRVAQARNSWQRVAKTPHLFVGGDAKIALQEIEALNGMERKIQVEAWDVVVPDGLTYRRPENPPSYDVSVSEDRLPSLVDTWRPQIRGTYKNSDGALQTKIVNQGDPGNIEDPDGWIDVRSGGARIKYGLGFEFVDAPPGLDIEYRLTFYRERDPFGWVKAGTFLEDGTHAGVTGVAMRLVGPMASQYMINYRVHCIDVGDSEYTAGNGFGATHPMGTLVSRSEYQVQGVRVVVLPR